MVKRRELLVKVIFFVWELFLDAFLCVRQDRNISYMIIKVMKDFFSLPHDFSNESAVLFHPFEAL